MRCGFPTAGVRGLPAAPGEARRAGPVAVLQPAGHVFEVSGTISLPLVCRPAASHTMTVVVGPRRLCHRRKPAKGRRPRYLPYSAEQKQVAGRSCTQGRGVALGRESLRGVGSVHPHPKPLICRP